MKAPDDTLRFLCILEELETSVNLLTSGFGHLQEIDMGNTFYHLPHQLMASGFERLMKCYISLAYKGRNGSYPNEQMMKDLGHDLENLLSEIRSNFYGGRDRALLQEEYHYISNDQLLQECMRILSLFGKKGRYYNFDLATGAAKAPIDPTSEWSALEARIEDPIPFAHDPVSLYRDYFPRVNSKLIAKMERLVRAIALQFTLGGHRDGTGELRRTAPVTSQFRNLTDAQLGKTDYRGSVRILQQEKNKWVRRAEEEITNGDWPTLVLTKAEFTGDWPFRENRVVLECRDRLFCIVNICGFAFALNGAARTKYGMPDPHDAGVAILGRSVGPFIDKALRLR